MCVFIQRVKKDVEKGTIHADMFLLKREGKDGQGTNKRAVSDKIQVINMKRNHPADILVDILRDLP